MNLPDLMSAPGAEPVQIEGNFRTTPARVFRAWTDPDELKQWFGSTTTALEVTVDCRVGGHWKIAFAADNNCHDVLSGEYLQIEPARHLVFSWTHERIDSNGNSNASAPSQVSVTFEAIKDGTRVRLLHESIVTESGRQGVGQGWQASLARLGTLVNDNPNNPTGD